MSMIPPSIQRRLQSRLDQLMTHGQLLARVKRSSLAQKDEIKAAIRGAGLRLIKTLMDELSIFLPDRGPALLEADGGLIDLSRIGIRVAVRVRAWDKNRPVILSTWKVPI